MTSSNKNKPSIKAVITACLLFLIVAIFSFLAINFKKPDIADNYNPYLKPMPKIYAQVLNKYQKNDSTFIGSITEKYGIREVTIFKANPSDHDLSAKFIVKVFQTNTDKIIRIKVPNKIALYSYNRDQYGLIVVPLPFVDIDKIEIEQEKRYTKHKAFKTIVKKPFKQLEINKNSLIKSIRKSDILSQPNPYRSVFAETLKSLDISYLPYSYSIFRKDSLVENQIDLEQFIKNKKLTIAKIENQNKFWELINTKDKALESETKFIGENSIQAKKLITSYLNQEKTFKDIFDLQKMSNYLALQSMFLGDCEKQIYLSYNNSSNLLEPFFVNSNCLGKIVSHIRKPLFDNLEVFEAYTNAINELSQLDFYNSIIKENKTFQKELILINSYNPNNIFNLDVIRINQRTLRKVLNANSLLISQVISIDEKQAKIVIENTGIFPVNIIALNYNPKKKITELDPEQTILSGSKDTIIINLPRSFENLFVSKKTKQVGFVLNKHTFNLNISYSIYGLEDVFYAHIRPFEEQEKVDVDLFREKDTIQKRTDIKINKNKNIISFNSKNVIINTPLVIPKGYKFVVDAGTQIDIVKGGKIISHSPLSFLGNSEDPIKLFSSDKKGQGILILAEGKQSILRHVFFEDLTNPRHGYWSVTGAVTFYESPVKLNYVTVKNNRCEDALNIVRTEFSMKNCTIENTQSDAFDGDFVKGTIIDCLFDNLGNDGIDVSGSDLIIKNVTISNAGDKGLSAGENSKMNISTVNISNSEIAVAGKDLSVVTAQNLKIINTKLGFTAFMKKPEFGPSQIYVKNVIMEGVETNYLIENSSSLYVDDIKIESSENVKDRMYGVEFGRSSAETRNSQ